MKCTVFRVNVPYFYASVPGNVDRMLAGLQSLTLTDVGDVEPGLVTLETVAGEGAVTVTAAVCRQHVTVIVCITCAQVFD